MKNSFLSSLSFRLKLFLITLRQIRIGVWISLFVAILGAINYEGRYITLWVDTKFTRSSNAIINQILLTYITGCIFYFLIELLYKTKKKIAVSTSVGNNVFLIYERIKHLLNEIGKTNEEDKIDFDLNFDKCRQCCDKINIDTKKVNVWYYPEYTFRQFVIRSCEEIKIAAEEMLSFSELFDEKWVYSLSKISGLSTKITKGLDIRFSKPTIESYYVWGLYAEIGRLKELQNKYDKDYFSLARMSAMSFHPVGLSFKVERKR